jgi:hypothetical protein
VGAAMKVERFTIIYVPKYVIEDGQVKEYLQAVTEERLYELGRKLADLIRRT